MLPHHEPLISLRIPLLVDLGRREAIHRDGLREQHKGTQDPQAGQEAAS